MNNLKILLKKIPKNYLGQAPLQCSKKLEAQAKKKSLKTYYKQKKSLGFMCTEKYSWRLDKQVIRSDTQAQVDSPCRIENKASSPGVQVQAKSSRCLTT